MPRAIAATSLKLTMPRILAPLISNTQIHRRADPAFRDHRQGHARVARCSRSLPLRFFHIPAIYRHETLWFYAEIAKERARGASSIASTTQQMSVSFGVAGDCFLPF